jgi:prolyl 4-hydroxylase
MISHATNSPTARDYDDQKDHMTENETLADDEEEDDDADDDEENDSLWNDFKSAWKQHMLAIVIALLATLLGYFHFLTPQQAIQGIEELLIRHDHVQNFQRMSNVTFCGATDLSNNMIKFRIPSEYLSVLERFYAADLDMDDFYEKDSNHQIQISDLDCAREQSLNSHFIKGFTTVYNTPSIQQITRDPESQVVALSFTGFAAKFINLSPKPKLLFWAGRGGHENAHRLISEVAPMEAVGTATTPGQSFFITPIYDSSHHLKRWTVTADDAVLVYEEEDFEPETLSTSLHLKYRMQKVNAAFGKDYLAKTARPWLSYFPRPPPLHKMWPADYLGQTHRISSNAKQFKDKDTTTEEDLRLRLTVTSVAPRVLEIESFLSEFECQFLIQKAKKKGLHASTVEGASGVDTQTRSSDTAWLSRQSSPIIDNIYRRAADVLQISESLMRHASPHHDKIASHHSISEEMQLVRYQKKQEYTPHHDFIYPSIANRHQPSRFATLLIYLKEPKKGGETTFPRSIQSTNHEGLTVTPKIGKAVLFYNMLPDGNVDDLSQHGSKAVEKGEKWIANLWVWDPIID